MCITQLFCGFAGIFTASSNYSSRVGDKCQKGLSRLSRFAFGRTRWHLHNGVFGSQ
jgi:hypothetical protein